MGTDLFAAAGRAEPAGPQTCAAAALTVTGIKPDEAGTLCVDDYIRFAFETPVGTAGTGTVALRDGDHALAEVGIDLATGRLRFATLVSFSRRARPLAASLLPALSASDGLPVFDAGAFGGGGALPRIEVTCALDILTNDRAAVIQIAPGDPDRLIRCGGALFLLAGQALWGFGADGLAPAQVAQIRG